MRIQLTVTDEQKEEIKRLMKLIGAETNREFFNSALAVLRWAIQEKEKGCNIVSITEKSPYFAELVSPALSNVKKTDQ